MAFYSNQSSNWSQLSKETLYKTITDEYVPQLRSQFHGDDRCDDTLCALLDPLTMIIQSLCVKEGVDNQFITECDAIPLLIKGLHHYFTHDHLQLIDLWIILEEEMDKTLTKVFYTHYEHLDNWKNHPYFTSYREACDANGNDMIRGNKRGGDYLPYRPSQANLLINFNTTPEQVDARLRNCVSAFVDELKLCRPDRSVLHDVVDDVITILKYEWRLITPAMIVDTTVLEQLTQIIRLCREQRLDDSDRLLEQKCRWHLKDLFACKFAGEIHRYKELYYYTAFREAKAVRLATQSTLAGTRGGRGRADPYSDNDSSPPTSDSDTSDSE